MRGNRFTQIAIVGATIAIAACAKEQANTTTDSAGGAMNPSDSSAMSGANTNAAPAMTDANIVAYLDAVNAADSAGGKIASTKGTSAAVRDFGKLMMGEHHALRAEGQAFAKKASITPEPASNDTTKQHAQHAEETLNTTPKGAAWDKAYIDGEVAMHQSVLDNATAAKNATQNADLKALIDKAAPVVQKHLDKAKEIQKSLTPAT
jgi:putative membrane protein